MLNSELRPDDYLPVVHSVVRREFENVPECVADYNDLVNIGVLGLMHAARNWDPSRAPFKTYCYRRIKGKIQDWLEKNWRHMGGHPEDDYEFPDHRTPLTRMSAKENKLILHSFLINLPIEEQRVIHLYYFCGLNGRQIAELTDCAESHVSAKLCRARARLKKTLVLRGIFSTECIPDGGFISIKENDNG